MHAGHLSRELGLPGAPKSDRPLRQCQGKCESLRLPEGGLQITPEKWVCANCSLKLLRRMH